MNCKELLVLQLNAIFLTIVIVKNWYLRVFITFESQKNKRH
jgi:hypothetical protein